MKYRLKFSVGYRRISYTPQLHEIRPLSRQIRIPSISVLSGRNRTRVSPSFNS